MPLLKIKAWIIVLVFIAGSASILFSVDRGAHLRDIDEAAWTFNGYFLDLYLSGDWDPATWREFDKYAQHPPAGKYLFGALEHAIGEPMRSMEPRRYWFENDVQVIDPHSHFIENLYARMSPRQLLAGRFMAAAFSALAGILFFFLARNFAGPLPSLMGYVLLITHPDFLAISTLAAIDSFLVAMSMLVLLLAMRMGRSIASGARGSVLIAAMLGAMLGISFATKIVAYAWIAPVAICALFPVGRQWGRALAFLCLASAVGFLVSYVLDPGLHGEPLAQIGQRIAWRFDRLEIQQMLFQAEKLGGLLDRSCFLVKHMFFMSISGSALVLPLFIMGFGSPFLPMGADVMRRDKWAALFLTSFFIALTLFSLPMAWFRYSAAGLPFVLLAAVLGVEIVVESVRGWNAIRPAIRSVILVVALIAALFSAALKQDFGERFCRASRGISEKDLFVSIVYKFTHLNPGTSESAHRFMQNYFEGKGDKVKARSQRGWLDRMKMGQ